MSPRGTGRCHAWREDGGWLTSPSAAGGSCVVDGRQDRRRRPPGAAVRTARRARTVSPGSSARPDGRHLFVAYAGPGQRTSTSTSCASTRPGAVVEPAAVLRASSSATRTTTAVAWRSAPTACSTSAVGDGANPPDDASGLAQDLGSYARRRCRRIDPQPSPERRRLRHPASRTTRSSDVSAGRTTAVFANGLRNPWRTAFDPVDRRPRGSPRTVSVTSGARRSTCCAPTVVRPGRGRRSLGWNHVEGDFVPSRNLHRRPQLTPRPALGYGTTPRTRTTSGAR